MNDEWACRMIHRHATLTWARPEATFAEMGMDCLDIMTIAHDIETRFGIELPDSEVERWACAGDVLRVIERAGQCAA